jgi:hypothetical protein
LATVDLTVRGAGIFGLATAWTALKRGANVRVIDPNGAGSGASGGIVGALQPHTPDVWNEKKQFQLDALLMAPDFWHEIEATSGISTGFAKAGRLQPLAGEREVVMARARSKGAAEFWGNAAIWDDTLSALIHPRRACASLTAAIKARGGDVTTQANDDGGAILWATGWKGLDDLNTAFGKLMGTGVKGQAALLHHEAAGRSQIFAGGIHFVPHNETSAIHTAPTKCSTTSSGAPWN